MNPIKHALRQLKLRPSLSIVVIMMLALGIGATTAMFSLYQSDSRPPAARARTRAAREHRAGAETAFVLPRFERLVDLLEQRPRYDRLERLLKRA